MTPDLRKYRKRLSHLDLSDAEKDRFIHSLWAVMENFADLGFQEHPLQQARRSDPSQLGAIVQELIESQDRITPENSDHKRP